jgi:predicted metalloprotease with PDZ domain
VIARSLKAFLCLALGVAGCRDRGAPAEPPFAGLSIDLTPDPGRGAIGVEVRLSADRAASVKQLSVARSWADTRGFDAIDDLAAQDADGPLPVKARVEPEGPDVIFDLARPARGALSIGYRARGGRSRFETHVTPERASAVGHAFLLLPRIEGAFPARVRFHVGPLGRGAEAASSFGFGAEVTTTATTEDLGRAAYVAGRLWIEQPAKDAPAAEAGKRLVIVGEPPFDGRTAWRTCMSTLAAVDRLFGAPAETAAERFTFMLVPEPGLGKAHDGAYLTRSLGLWFDPRRGLDAGIRLTVAHELVHRWLGDAVRLVDGDERDATWFSEGFTVHFARRVLLDAGLAKPADVLVDIRRTLGEPPPGEEQSPREYRRGAQWAAFLDAALRRASGGARSLDDVARELVQRARSEQKVRLPVAALREILARDLGPQGAADFDRLLDRPDTPVDLPEGAFGPCFRRVARDTTVFELGFEGLRGTGGRVHAVVKGSAAERAGLREGMVVQWSKVPREEDALRGAEVELSIGESRHGKRIKYRPIGKKALVSWEVAPCAAAR